MNSTNDKLENATPHFGNTLLSAVPSVVYNEDCVDGLKRFSDNYFDLAIVDPPYGIGAGKRVGTTYKEGVLRNKKGFGNTKLYTAKNWDNEVPTAEYWSELFRVSKNQIVWGGNYFTQYLPESRGWIYWDKKIINHQIDNYSDGGLACKHFEYRSECVSQFHIFFVFSFFFRGQFSF